MKKIGFVDYYLSEWHANNYPEWIKTACANAGAEYELAYAWAELDKSLVDGVTTDEWCEKYGAQKCETLEELCEQSDVIVVLAPSNPETHLRYAETVLKYGKRTYIDKTFAPDYATARKIFELGEQGNSPFFSSSALRFATELSAVAEPTSVITTGGGGSLEEYIIHQSEMVIKKLGVGVEKIKATRQGTQYVLDVRFTSDKQATMVYGKNLPFSIYMQTDNGPEDECWNQITSSFFDGLIADMVNFFETGNFSFDTKETLEVIKLVEMAIKAKNSPGEWIEA